MTNSQLDTTNESQEVSPFPASDKNAHINRRTQRHSKYKTEKTLKIHKRSTALERSVEYFTGGLKPVSRRQPHPFGKTYGIYFDNIIIFSDTLENNISSLDAFLQRVHQYNLTIVRKRAKIRDQYNQAPHLTQDTNGKVTILQLDITNESQEVSPFQAGDHKASTNRRA